MRYRAWLSHVIFHHEIKKCMTNCAPAMLKKNWNVETCMLLGNVFCSSVLLHNKQLNQLEKRSWEPTHAVSLLVAIILHEPLNARIKLVLVNPSCNLWHAEGMLRNVKIFLVVPFDYFWFIPSLAHCRMSVGSLMCNLSLIVIGVFIIIVSTLASLIQQSLICNQLINDFIYI